MIGSTVCMTNFYPYCINTGLFSGFKPKIRVLLPALDQIEVVEYMYKSIMAEREEVFIKPIFFWFTFFAHLMPLDLRINLMNFSAGEGMNHFIGRRF